MKYKVNSAGCEVVLLGLLGGGKSVALVAEFVVPLQGYAAPTFEWFRYS